MNLLEKALYTVGGLLTAGALAFNVACSSTSSTSTPYPTRAPLLTSTPTPTPVLDIKEENLEKLLSDLFSYYYVDARNKLAEEIKNLPVPNPPKTRESLKQFSNDFQIVQTKLNKLLSDYRNVQQQIGIFKDYSQIEIITSDLKQLEENIANSVRYDDPSLIDGSLIGKLHTSKSIEPLSFRTGERGSLSNRIVDPIIKGLMDYFKKSKSKEYVEGDVGQFRIMMSSNGNIEDIAGTALTDVGTAHMRLIGDFMQYNKSSIDMFDVPITAENYIKVVQIFILPGPSSIDVNRSPPLSYAIMQFEDTSDAKRRWDSSIGDGALKTEGEYCMERMCLDRVFWRRDGGNYYAYGDTIGRYVILINPSSKIWTDWTPLQVTKSNEFLLSLRQ